MAVLTLLLSAALALVPFGIHVDISGTCDSTNTTRSVYLEKCESFAMTPGDTAKEFIKKMASGAGMAAGDLITASLGIAAVGSGMALASSQGQQWGMTMADALSNVVEAADYPDYDSLSAEQKTLWGDKENYDSAKYVSLMNGLGFETEYERFEQFQASGGGNFDFSDDVQDRLNQFNRIGSLWQSRLGVLFGDIAGLITNREAIINFPAGGASSSSFVFDASEIDDWPSKLPDRVNVNTGTELLIYRDGNTLNTHYISGQPVYWLVIQNDYQSTRRQIIPWLFSKTSFSYGYNSQETMPNLSYNSTAFQDVYCGGSQLVAVKTNNYSYNMSYNSVETSSRITFEDLNFAAKIILDSGETVTEEGASIVDYPDGDISNNQRIYYPENGVTPDTTWNQFTTPQTPIRDNETPYNPGNQTQTPEWQTQTEENVLPLLDIKFDKLFPFSMLSDIPKLFDKVELLTGEQAQSGVYNRIEIPLNWGQNQEDAIVLDLVWLYDLLNMIRPAMQILLVALLLITCIEFWRGILTG